MQDMSNRSIVSLFIISSALLVLGWIVGVHNDATTGFAVFNVESTSGGTLIGIILLTIGISLAVSTVTTYLIVHHHKK